MRYMMFIKHTQDYGNVQPPAALYEEMGKFIEETRRAATSSAGRVCSRRRPALGYGSRAARSR